MIRGTTPGRIAIASLLIACVAHGDPPTLQALAASDELHAQSAAPTPGSRCAALLITFPEAEPIMAVVPPQQRQPGAPPGRGVGYRWKQPYQGGQPLALEKFYQLTSTEELTAQSRVRRRQRSTRITTGTVMLATGAAMLIVALPIAHANEASRRAPYRQEYNANCPLIPRPGPGRCNDLLDLESASVMREQRALAAIGAIGGAVAAGGLAALTTGVLTSPHPVTDAEVHDLAVRYNERLIRESPAECQGGSTRAPQPQLSLVPSLSLTGAGLDAVLRF
jgi:hypothetical protein